MYFWIHQLDFFIFNFFLNNILILTRLPFYLHGIAHLVAPSVLARQLASVAPVRVAQQACHAGAATWTYATWALTCSALSRHMRWCDRPCRAMRTGATMPMSWARASPFSPFLSSLPPDRSASREAAAGVAPQIPSKSGVLEGVKWGESFPYLPWRYSPNYFVI